MIGTGMKKFVFASGATALAIAMTAGSAGAAAKSYQKCPANQGSGLVSTNGLSCSTALKVLAVAEGKPFNPALANYKVAGQFWAQRVTGRPHHGQWTEIGIWSESSANAARGKAVPPGPPTIKILIGEKVG
jgi:hypothetical protein